MSQLPSKENKTPPGGVCHDLWGAEFLGSPCHNRQVKYLKNARSIYEVPIQLVITDLILIMKPNIELKLS